MFVFRLQRRTYSRISTRSSPAANADRFKIPLLKPHPLRLAAQRKTVTTEGQSGESCSPATSPTHRVVNPTVDYRSWAVPQEANWTGTGGKRECLMIRKEPSTQEVISPGNFGRREISE
jgi:hypothetical protein